MNAIVLLHGWGMNAAVFDELSQYLARDFSVSAPDLAGYGATGMCEPYTLEHLALRISAIAPERCHVVGWSLGGQVALVWARARTRQVESLTLIGTNPSFVTRDGWTAAVEPDVLQAFGQALATDCSTTLGRFASLQAQGDDAYRSVAQKLRSVLGRRALPAARALEEGLRILERSDLRELLSAIEQRCLVVHGERDQLVPVAAATYLSRALPHARLEIVQGAAHAPFLSQPHAVGRLLAEHCR